MNPETVPAEVQPAKNIKSSPSHLIVLFLVILGVATLSASGTYYYLLPQLKSNNPQTGIQYQQANDQSNAQQNTMKQVTPVSGNTQGMSGWKTYTIKSIGLTFQLPPSLTTGTEYTEDIIKAPENVSAQKGSELCVRITKKATGMMPVAYASPIGCFPQDTDVLTLGSSSPDFEAPRGGAFTESQGFTTVNGKYFVKENLNRTEAIPADRMKVIQNPNGFSIVMIKGQNSSTPAGNFALYGSLGDNTIGALINTKDTIYQGIALQTKLVTIDEQTFNQILSTFKFSN